jgi:membrane protease YdiL (CAAX protease family)
MSLNKKYQQLYEALLCCFALMVFSFFIHHSFPLKLLSFTALLIPAWIFSRKLQSLSDLRTIIGIPDSVKSAIVYCVAGILPGVLLATLYRLHLGIPLLPVSFHMIVLVAAIIGCSEELVFRGFIQEQVKSIYGPFSVLFSSLAHTAYKCCLFISPVVPPVVNVPMLAFWTLTAGILIGSVKHYTKSILPPVIAHALFDILVYAEFANYPWWVW